MYRGMHVQIKGHCASVCSSLDLVGSEDQTEALRLGDKCLYPLSIFSTWSVNIPEDLISEEGCGALGKRKRSPGFELLQNCKGKQIIQESLFIVWSNDVVCDFPQQAYFPN